MADCGRTELHGNHCIIFCNIFNKGFIAKIGLIPHEGLNIDKSPSTDVNYASEWRLYAHRRRWHISIYVHSGDKDVTVVEIETLY